MRYARIGWAVLFAFGYRVSSKLVVAFLGLCLALSNMACASSMATKYPQARFVPVCARPPGVEPEAHHWVYSDAQQAISDEHDEVFDAIAKRARRIYRYDFYADPSKAAMYLGQALPKRAYTGGCMGPGPLEAHHWLEQRFLRYMGTDPRINLSVGVEEEVDIVTEGLTPIHCDACGQDKYDWVVRGMFPRFVDEPTAALAKSRQFGGDGWAFRAVFMSQELVRALQAHNVRGANFAPIDAAMPALVA